VRDNGRLVLGWPSWRLRAALSGGAWTAEEPLDHLLSDTTTEVARSVDLDPASLVIRQSWDLLVPVGITGLVVPNATRACTVRQTRKAGGVEIDRTAFEPIHAPVVPFGSVPLEHPQFWDGQLLDEQLQGQLVTGVHFWEVGGTLVDEIVWELRDDDNPDGHLEVAIVDAAQALQLQVNFPFGSEFDAVFNHTVTELPGGGRRTAFGAVQKSFRGRPRLLPRGQATLLRQMHMQLRDGRAVLVHPWPRRPERVYDSFFGVDLAAARQPEEAFERAGAELDFEEIV